VAAVYIDCVTTMLPQDIVSFAAMSWLQLDVHTNDSIAGLFRSRALVVL